MFADSFAKNFTHHSDFLILKDSRICSIFQNDYPSYVNVSLINT